MAPTTAFEEHEQTETNMNKTVAYGLGKVPEASFGFWIIKIAATTLGETGGDAVTMSMNLGYLVGTAILAAMFIVAVGAQIAVKRFQPYLFWAVIKEDAASDAIFPATVRLEVDTGDGKKTKFVFGDLGLKSNP